MWGPQDSVQLVYNPNFTTVYGTQITVVTGANLQTNKHHWGASHCMYQWSSHYLPSPRSRICRAAPRATRHREMAAVNPTLGAATADGAMGISVDAHHHLEMVISWWFYQLSMVLNGLISCYNSLIRLIAGKGRYLWGCVYLSLH